MRLKIVISVLLAGLAVVIGIYFLKPAGSQPQTETVAVGNPTVASQETKPASSGTPSLPPTETVAPVAAANAPATPSDAALAAALAMNPDAAAVQAKLDLLNDLQANYDAASLQAIHDELTNTNPIIRHAAIESTIQFRDRASIPVLKDLAARTTDPEEKQELLDAAEFLTLPSYTEVMAEIRKAKLEAQGAGQP